MTIQSKLLLALGTISLGALLFFTGSPQVLALCDQDTATPPEVLRINSITLNAGHTALTVSADIAPGSRCVGGAEPIFTTFVQDDVQGLGLSSTRHVYQISSTITDINTISVGALVNGTYTMRVLASNTGGESDKTASFTISRPNLLTLTKSGAGTGTVTSNPTGINCASGCPSASASYANGAVVTLSASANQSNGSRFAGWSGSGCSGTGSCVVTMSQARSVTASFSNPSAPTATCSASPSSPQIGQTVTWTAFPSGGAGAPYTYAWTGDSGFPNGATTNPVTTSYSTAGQKTASVTVTSGGQSVTAGCSVGIQNEPQQGARIDVHSNRDTMFSLSGPTPQTNQALTASTTRTFTGVAGTYTISPASQQNCTVSIDPSGTQSLASGGVISFNIEYTCSTPAPTCSITPGTAQPGQTVTATGANGTNYTWSALGSSSTSGSGDTFPTSYTTAGTKTITVTSGGQTGQCTVNIEPLITGTLSCDIDANNADGSITVPYGGSALISWNTNGSWASGSNTADAAWWCPVGAPSCKPRIGSETTGPLYASRTYNYLCAGYATTGADSVVVNVSPVPPACFGDVNIVSNVATTWTLSGASPQTQARPETSKSYSDLTCGSYTITPAALSGYVTPNPVISPAASQTLSSGDTLTYTLTYTPIGSVTPTVDIKVNGSDAPAPVIIGSPAALSWTTVDVEPGSCIASAVPASAGWSGGVAENGGQNSASLDQQTTFTLTCRKIGELVTTSDSVTVSVRQSQCNDGIDNDGDGEIDGDDPGCGGGDDDDDDSTGSDDSEGNAWPQCNDGIDNNDPEDTLADELDPGCLTGGVYDPTDNDESNAGVVIGACGDGFDNDGDGSIDGADSGCASGDNTEQDEPDIREI